MTHAPVVQLLLTVQFEPAATNLTILDWAELRGFFATDFPVFQQIARAGPMHAMHEPVSFEAGDLMPRFGLHSEDFSSVVLLQDDRVSVGWNRISTLDDDPHYPGFSRIFEKFIGVLGTVRTFIASRSGTPVELTNAEVGYTDAFVVGTSESQTRQLPDIFRNIAKLPELRFHQMNLSYTRYFDPNVDELQGSVLNTIIGPRLLPSGEMIVNLQSVVRFLVTDLSPDGLHGPFEAAHQVALDTFKTLVFDEEGAI